jgi:TPR repeat protein
LEFQAAEDILKKNIGSDLSEAVRLLWASVEKGNSNAEVALAGLYIEGKGVSKNCDQAKILLTAAARKGGARTQDLLSRFQGESCE